MATQSVRGNCKSFKKGINLTVLEGMHQFIMYIMYVVQPVRRGRSVRGSGKRVVDYTSLAQYRKRWLCVGYNRAARVGCTYICMQCHARYAQSTATVRCDIVYTPYICIEYSDY